jgi:hypothetical protein
LTKQNDFILKATVLIFLQVLFYFNVISQVTGKDETILSKLVSGIERPKVSLYNQDSLEKANSDYQFSARNKRIHKEGSHYYYIEYWPNGSVKIKAEVEPILLENGAVFSENLETRERTPFYFGILSCRFHGEHLVYSENDPKPTKQLNYVHGVGAEPSEIEEKFESVDRNVQSIEGKFYYMNEHLGQKLIIKAKVEPAFVEVVEYIDDFLTGERIEIHYYKPSFQFHGQYLEYSRQDSIPPVITYYFVHGKQVD